MSPRQQSRNEEASLVTERALAYMNDLLPPRSPELVAMEERAARTRFPIIGPLAGQFCYLLARSIRARRIFELGSGYGYSTAWFARAVQENGGGRVHHVVWDTGLSAQARRHLDRMGFGAIVEYHVGEAVSVLSRSEDEFDLILCDINKEQYPGALPVIKARLRPGGVLVADNAWWFGGVVSDTDRSEPTEGIRRFTQALAADRGWILTFVPLRDGLLVGYRTGDEIVAEPNHIVVSR